MHWQYTPYVPPLLISAAVSAALALYAWRHRSVPGATSFAWLMLAAAWWSLAYALELGSVGKSAKLFWVKVEYPGIVTVSVAWLTFVLQYTGREKWLSRRNLLLLAIVPLITLIMVWTSGMHRLFYSSTRLDTSGSWPVLDLDYGGWFWVYIVYSYLSFLLSTILVLQTLLRSLSLYRGQVRTLLIGALVPWLGSALYVFDLSPFPNLDLAPFAFTITGLVVTWGLFRFRLLDIVPVARDAVVAGMQDGVLVLDGQGRIVDLNPAAERILARAASEIVGQTVAYALSDRSDLVELLESATETHTEITLLPRDAPPDEGEAQRTYDVRISSLRDRHGRFANRLVVLRDITERVQAESQRDATLEALRESEEKYRDLVENINEVIFAVDTNGMITYISPVIEPLSGYSPSELTGRSFTQFIHSEDLPGLSASFQKTISGHLEPHEYRVLARSGEIRWVRSSSRLIFDRDRVVGMRGVLTDITQFKRIEEEQRERRRFLASLNDITRAALETPDLTTMLQTLADQMGELLGADGSYITLWDEATQTTIPAAAYGEWRASYHTVAPKPDETTMTASVLRAGHPLVVEDVYDTPYLSPRIAQLFPDRSLLALPLVAGDRKLGAALIAFNEPHHFSPDEVARGEQAAGQIALAVAKALLLEETQASWREAETLRQAGMAVTEILSLDEVLERILVQLEQVVPYDSASVQLLRDDHLEVVVGRGFPEPQAVVGLKFPVPGDNPNTKVIEGRKPVILADAKAAYPIFHASLHAHLGSWLGVPLSVRDRIIGMLSVDSVRPGYFSQEHIRLITPFASQVAVAIENARLFEETERLKGFNEAIVQGVAEAILITDAEGSFTFANPAVEALLGYTREELMGLHWDAIIPEDEMDKVRQEATKWVQGIESRYEMALLSKAGQVIPIIVSVRPMFEGEKFVGVLAAWTDITERVRMEDALERRVNQLVTLNRIAHHVTSILDPQVLLQYAVDILQEDLGYRRAAVLLLDVRDAGAETLASSRPEARPEGPAESSNDEEAHELYVVAATDEFWKIIPDGYRQPLGKGAIGTAVKTGKTVLVSDATSDPRVYAVGDWFSPSSLSAPILIGGAVMGVLEIEADVIDAFDENDVMVMESLANQIAAAIENARLYGAVQQELIERAQAEQALQTSLARTEALYHIARSLIAYESLPELLQTVTNDVAETLLADRVTLITFDLEQRQVTHMVKGGPGSGYVVPVSFDELWNGLSGWVLRGTPPRPALSPKGEPDPRESPEVQRRRAETNCGAIIVVPVRYQDKTLGTMTAINCPDERDFTQEDVDLMMTMAHQAAIAINNAHLIEALRQYTAELEARNEELDAFAHTVAHDLKNPLARTVGYAELLQRDYATIPDDALRDWLDTIAKSGRKMSYIIDGLLLLATVRKAEQVDVGPLDMASIVAEVRERLTPMIQEYQAEIILPSAEAWPVALGYAPWIEEVWVNYLSNAIKYGGRPPRVELGASRQVDGAIRFWVRDNGPGLTTEEQARLFTPFTRLSQTRVKGHGLGLSIVRRILERLSGEVGVESQVGQGSVFSFTLKG